MSKLYLHTSAASYGWLALSIIFILSLVNCSPNLREFASEPSKLEGFAQGTTYHITYFLPLDIKDRAATELTLKQAVTAELQRIDQSISNYRSDSDIERFNSQLTTEPQQVSAEIVQLVEQARRVSIASHGCYDITIKPLFDLWGFKKNEFHLPSEQELQDARGLIGMEKIVTRDATHLQKMQPNLRIDLSSIGQGYSVGRLAGILESHRIHNYVVEIGGELTVRGKKADGTPWRIAMEKPLPNERKVEKIAEFTSGDVMSLMPSGTYHHYFDNQGKRYSHILDARTGKPVTHNTLVANAFIADPTLADAWSTALLCLGSEEGIAVANENNIPAFFVDQEDKVFVEKKSQPMTSLQSVRLENP